MNLAIHVVGEGPVFDKSGFRNILIQLSEQPVEVVESETLEVKGWCESEKQLAEKFAEAVSCLANAHGGAVLIGIESDLPDIRKFSSNPYLNVNPAWIGARIQDMTSPPVDCEVFDLTELLTDIGIPNATAFGISVPRKAYLGQHFTVKGVSKIRRGKDCKPFLTTAEDDRTNIIVQQLGIDDLSMTSINWAQARHRATFNSTAASDDQIDFLSSARLIDPFLLDEENEPRYRVRLAALILFGKQAAIIRYLPCFETILTTQQGTVRIQKNLVDTMRELLFNDSGIIRQHFPTIPVRTLQELLINAYVHRCWRTAAPVMIKISGDFTIENPGGLLPGLSTSNLLYGIPQYRNFALAEAARFSGLCDKIGQGINIIFESIVSLGLPFPFTSDDDTFRAEIRMSRSAVFAEFVRRRSATLDNADEIMVLRLCFDRDQPVPIKEVRDTLQRDTRTTCRVLQGMCKKNMLESVNEDTFQLTPSVRIDIQTVFNWDQYGLFQ